MIKYKQKSKQNSFLRMMIITLLFLTIYINSKIVINSPDSLRQFFNQKYPNGIPYSIANYGDVPYGKIFTGQVDKSQVLQNCIYDQIDTSSIKTGLFLLAERNDCTFTQKSLNAQKQGAKLVIISDSVQQQSQKIIMADDGRGQLVHIPTILIRKQDGDKFVQTMGQNQTIILTMLFDTNKTSNVSLNIFLQANQHHNYVFMRKFKWYYNRIKDRINLSIRYRTYKCDECFETDCFANKQYCQNAFGYWGVQNIGQQVILQQLREQILFQDNPEKWWKYMSSFDKQCVDWAVVQQCSQKIMDDIQVDYKQINKKVQGTFSADKSSNSLLQQNQAKRKESHAILSPSIYVNNIQYRGNIQAKDVFQMICNSLTPYPQQCDLSPKVNKGLSIWQWVIIGVSIFIIFLIFLLVCYRRYARKKASQDVNSQVNQLVNQYITMYQTEKFNQPEINKQRKSSLQQHAY